MRVEGGGGEAPSASRCDATRKLGQGEPEMAEKMRKVKVTKGRLKAYSMLTTLGSTR